MFIAENGKPFWAVFQIENAVNAYGADGYLVYDPSAIELVVENGAFVSQVYDMLGNSSMINLSLKLLNGAPGTLLFAINKGIDKTGVNGSGKLWRTKIRTLRSGTHTLTFTPGKCFARSPKLVVENGVTQAEKLPCDFVDAALQSIDTNMPDRARVTITFEAV